MRCSLKTKVHAAGQKSNSNAPGAILRREMPEPERKANWKGRLRVCGCCRRSISAWSPNANGSMRRCWNLKAVRRPTNTNARDIRDDQDRDQCCGKCCENRAASAIGIE